MSRPNAADNERGARDVRRERLLNNLSGMARAGQLANIRPPAPVANVRLPAPVASADIRSPAPIGVIPLPPRALVAGTAPKTVSQGSSSSTASLKRTADTAFGIENVETWATTQMAEDTFSFLWTLNGYTGMAAGREEILSPAFKGGAGNHAWQLKIQPKKISDDQEYFAVHLILLGFGNIRPADGLNVRSLGVRFQLSFLDAEGRPVKAAGSSAMKACEFKRSSVWGYDKFLAASDLMSSTRPFIHDDKLAIHCRIWTEGEIKHTFGKGGVVPQQATDTENSKQQLDLLQNDFKKMLFDDSFADVALITSTKTFMAHKVILGARSLVFKGIFNSRTSSPNESIEINNFEAGVVKAMLEYIYTGETSSLKEKANDLLRIAEIYGLHRLKHDCGIAIAAKLTIENCAETLLFAHLQKAVALKRKALHFINKNKHDAIKTSSFQRLKSSHPMLLVDLYFAQ